jgi:hypothetical protein
MPRKASAKSVVPIRAIVKGFKRGHELNFPPLPSIFPDSEAPGRHNTRSRTAAVVLGQSKRVSRQVQEVLACPLPRVIGPDARVGKGTKLRVRPHQFVDLAPCRRLHTT